MVPIFPQKSDCHSSWTSVQELEVLACLCRPCTAPGSLPVDSSSALLVLLGLCLTLQLSQIPGRCETSPYSLALFFYLLFYTLWSWWFHELIMNSPRCLLEIIFIDMVNLTKALFK